MIGQSQQQRFFFVTEGVYLFPPSTNIYPSRIGHGNQDKCEITKIPL